ncbi:MAG TPA: glycoside-pentoside-hexuronide (GPH):cation symporter [Steroidobacter sp.]|uniref:MFS transporter n=1 Tax=Steroidobacter sp. TaxID=1978227 RepID=UPI002EDB18D3
MSHVAAAAETVQPSSDASLPWRTRLGFSVGDLGFNFYWQGVGLFLYFFYTDVMGLSPRVAGIAYAAASLWDALIDPIIGAAADRTRTRWGSYRPYLLIGAIPCGLAFVACFWVPPFQGGALIAYASATLILLRTCYAVASIPYLALSAKLTSNYHERGMLAALRMMFATVGALIVAYGMPSLVQLAADDPNTAWSRAALLFAAAATVVLFVTFLVVREPDSGPLPTERNDAVPVLHSLARDVGHFWGILRRNRPLAQLFTVIIVGYVASQMYAKCILYWCKYGLHDEQFVKYVLPIPAFAALIAAPFWTWLSRRTSKREAWLIALAVASASCLAFVLDDSRSTTSMLIITCFVAFGLACTPLMFFAMIPDTVDYNEVVTGRRDEAKIFGFAVFAQKLALAVNAVVLGQLLELSGFVANQEQTEGTLLGLKLIMGLIPAVGGVLAAAVLWRYPLDAKRHGQVLETLDQRRRQPRAVDVQAQES